MSKLIHRNPPAKRLINSMRAMGYTFSTSIADIIDNSISANSKNIHILYDTLIDEPYLEIIDDGQGMDYDELLNALTFGSVRNYSEKDLGKFGLGLKSASLAQCRRLMVCSKKNNVIRCMGYDLDTINSTDDWNIIEYSLDEINEIPNIDFLRNQASGTIVKWEDFDFIKSESKNHEYEYNLREIISSSKKHVELVFHRFYDEISIFYNGERIEKRDPFLLDSKPRQQTGISYNIPMGNLNIRVTPYTLPFANSLTNEEKKLLGLEKGKSLYDDQGFYIYRNKRLIIWGSWLRMNAKSEYNKLARIQVDVPTGLDDIWMLDVKKSTAKIPEYIKEQLKISVFDSKGKSTRVLKRPGKLEQDAENKLWLRREFTKEDICYELNRDNELFKKITNEISDEVKPYFYAYIKEVEKNLPKFTIRDDIEDNLKIQNQISEGLEETEEELLNLLKDVDHGKVEKLLDFLLTTKPYDQLKDNKGDILKKVK